jgi:hypothetical protein
MHPRRRSFATRPRAPVAGERQLETAVGTIEEDSREPVKGRRESGPKEPLYAAPLHGKTFGDRSESGRLLRTDHGWPTLRLTPTVNPPCVPI